jgi:hypothetical protein
MDSPNAHPGGIEKVSEVITTLLRRERERVWWDLRMGPIERRGIPCRKETS